MRSRPLRAPLALLTCLATFAGLPASAAAICPSEDVRSNLQSEAAMSQSILCLVNEERSAAGIGPVHRNPKLEQAALVHSRDMVSNGFFAHTSPDGADFVKRITDAGYTAGARSWIAGENLAWGSGSLSTPAEMVQGWMESAPHRANLLRGRYREIGIGVVRGTPEEASSTDGVTVSSEYGFRGGAKAKRAKKGRAARKRSARR